MSEGAASDLTPGQSLAVREAAAQALRDASAIGVLPTPVDDIMAAARVSVVPLRLDDNYIMNLRRTAEAAGKALLSALSKVWGVFDPHSRIAFIDPATPKEKLPFLKLHEGGHAILPWQSVFGLFEDCRLTLDPHVKAQFESEANFFASEVLFQLDGFAAEARDLAFGIKAPIALARRYGASVYATLYRYVASSDRACALLVFNPPEAGGLHRMRRTVESPTFRRVYADAAWPATVMSDHPIARLFPLGRMALEQPFLVAGGGAQPGALALADSFATPFQTFVLVYPPRPLVPTVAWPR